MLPIKRENNQALYPSQISIALSAIALVLLQALLISALSSTPSYAAESQHMTKQQIKKRVDSFCKDPSTSLFKDTDTTKDTKRLNYALVKRCFKKLANKKIDCPLDTNASSNYAKYDTAYENAMKHWIDSDLRSKEKWKSKLIDELVVYYKTFNDRCIPELATQACKENTGYKEKTQDNAAEIQSCSKYYAGIIKWCILNKKAIQTCDNESPEQKLGMCMSTAYFVAQMLGSPNKRNRIEPIEPNVFASTLKLDIPAIARVMKDKNSLQESGAVIFDGTHGRLSYTPCKGFAN